MVCMVFIINFLTLNFSLKIEEAHASITRSSEMTLNSTRGISFNMAIQDKVYTVFDFTPYIAQNDRITKLTLKKGNTTIEGEKVNDKKWKAKFVALHEEEFDIQVEANIAGVDQKLLFRILYEDTDLNFRPTMAIDGNNVECDLKSWAARFSDNDSRVDLKIVTGGKEVIGNTPKIISDLKSNKVVFTNKANSFNKNVGYTLIGTNDGHTYRYKFFCDTTGQGNGTTKVFKNMNTKIQEATIKDNSNLDLKIFSDKVQNHAQCVLKAASNGTNWVTANSLDKAKKIGTFSNYNVALNKTINTRVEWGSNGTTESQVNLHVLEKFIRCPYGVKVSSTDNNGVSIWVARLSNFLSLTGADNKIYVYEIGDNFQKTKIGEKVGNITQNANNTVTFTSGKKLVKNKSYLVEVTNGTKTIATSFVFLPIDVGHKNVEYTTAKVTWTYPVGYTPVSGDKIDIFLRNKSNNEQYSGTPKVSLTQGSGTNLINTTESEITGLAPGSEYEAKVVLSKQGAASESITSFTTKNFTLKDYIAIKDVKYGDDHFKIAYPRNRKITVQWDYEPEDMTFGENDKVQIFIKPNNSSGFENYPNDNKYKNPVFEEINGSTNKLKGLKEANITMPSYFDNYHVDLIYTIGGKKIINNKPQGVQGEVAYNRRTVQATVNPTNIEVVDKTQTSAKIRWSYDKNGPSQNDIEKYIPEQGHIIKGAIKKISSLNDKTTNGFGDGSKNQSIFYYEHGVEDVDLLNTTEFDLTGLEPDQFYRLRVQHILQMPGFDDRYRVRENYFNFKTESFSISNLQAQVNSEDSRKIELTWDTNGVPVFPGEGENGQEDIKVYLKEATTSEYPQEALTTTIQDNAGVPSAYTGDEAQVQVGHKKCTIDIPKYNTQYNAKVEYTLKGNKKVSEFVLINSEIDMNVSVNVTSATAATVTCTLPSGYVKKDNDKIKLTVADSSYRQKDLPAQKELTISGTTATESISSGLTENNTYNVTADFINENNAVVDTETTSFKATADFQIKDMKVSDIKATTAKLTWDFTPSGKLDTLVDDTDKVEIQMKINNPPGRSKRDVDEDDTLEDWTTVFTVIKSSTTEEVNAASLAVDIDEVLSVPVSSSTTRSKDNVHSQAKKYKVQNFKDFKSLDLTGLKVGKDYSIKVKYDISTALSSDTNAVKEAEYRFKTVADTFKSTVFVSNQTSATFGWEYPAGYTIQEGDKVEIFIKEVEAKTAAAASNEPAVASKKSSLPKLPSKKTTSTSATTETTPQVKNGDWGSALLTLTHGTNGNGEGDTVDLNEVTAVDVSGLTPERKYKGKISFTMGKDGSAYTISSEVDISTHPFEITSFTLDSYDEYDILVNWEIEPKNMVFNPADKLEIFVKLASEDNYPADPVYKLTTTDTQDGKNISNTFSDYILATTLGAKQKAKLKYTVGEREYEKELEFTNSINPITAKASSVNETRALIEITPPDNYEFVNGDKLLIYAKDEFSEGANVETDDFLVFEGVQSDELSIADNMRLIELSYLLPEADYDVRVKLELLDGSVSPVDLNFRTKALPVTEPQLKSIGYNSSVISWDYGDNAIDFYLEEGNYEYTDKLIIAHKETDGTPIPADINVLKQLSHKEYLGEDIKTVKDATIEVEDPSKEYDVAVCYDLGGLIYMKTTKASYLSLAAEEDSITSGGAKLVWKYPTNVQFADADKTEVFVRKSSETEYPSEASFSSTGSGTTTTTLDNLETGTEYIAKVQITKEGLQIDPVEVTFTTTGAFGEETVIEEMPGEIAGTEATISIPESLPVDTSGELGLVMGDEEYSGFSIAFSDDGSGFTITPTIPKKTYTNIQVTVPLEDGSTHTIVIPELVTEPADTAQDWLSNAYWFAFERFPDEGGYNYWYADRMKTKTLNGEYFLKNLMFAEDEFTNRNLSDQDLIAALYQIVVNREYDQGGLDFWVGIYNENLQNAGGNKKLAQEVLVDRMVHEAEFGKLCEKVGIFWTQQDQDAAGVPS